MWRQRKNKKRTTLLGTAVASYLACRAQGCDIVFAEPVVTATQRIDENSLSSNQMALDSLKVTSSTGCGALTWELSQDASAFSNARVTGTPTNPIFEYDDYYDTLTPMIFTVKNNGILHRSLGVIFYDTTDNLSENVTSICNAECGSLDRSAHSSI